MSEEQKQLWKNILDNYGLTNSIVQEILIVTMHTLLFNMAKSADEKGMPDIDKLEKESEELIKASDTEGLKMLMKTYQEKYPGFAFTK